METALEITRHQDPEGRTVLTVRGEVDNNAGSRLRTALTEQIFRSKALVLRPAEVPAGWPRSRAASRC